MNIIWQFILIFMRWEASKYMLMHMYIFIHSLVFGHFSYAIQGFFFSLREIIIITIMDIFMCEAWQFNLPNVCVRERNEE